MLLPRGAAHVLHGAGDVRSAPGKLDDAGPLLQRLNTDGAGDMDLPCGRFTYVPGSADLAMSALPEVLHVSLAKERHLDFLDKIVAMLRDEVMQLQSGALTIVTSLSQILFVLALRSYARREGIPASFAKAQQYLPW